MFDDDLVKEFYLRFHVCLGLSIILHFNNSSTSMYLLLVMNECYQTMISFKSFFYMFVLQLPPLYNNMPKKGKEKTQATEGDPDVEVVSKMEIIYEDTKAITGGSTRIQMGEYLPYASRQNYPRCRFGRHTIVCKHKKIHHHKSGYMP